MAYARPKVFTAWSFSRYSDYARCPAFAKYKHLDKVKTPEMVKKEQDEASGAIPESPMTRGARVAAATDKYLSKRTAKLPIELMPLAQTYRDLRKLGNLSVEQGWGFTRDWRPCSPTDWNNCWLRVKIDVAYIEEAKGVGDILHIKDNKTGQFRENKNVEYEEQLNLYGTAGLAYMPTVVKVTTQLLYSDLGAVYPVKPKEFTVKQLPGMQAKWEKRVRPMFNDTRFAPKPGYYCRYCEFSKAKGGPCRF